MSSSPKQRRIKLLSQPNAVCYYCGTGFSPNELKIPGPGTPFAQIARRLARPTVEHLLALSVGGTNRRANCKLAHWICNYQVGNRPVEEKLRMRESMLRAGPPDFGAEAERLRTLRAQRFAASARPAVPASGIADTAATSLKLPEPLPQGEPSALRLPVAAPAVSGASHQAPIGGAENRKEST